jgi:hypothetical protein
MNERLKSLGIPTNNKKLTSNVSDLGGAGKDQLNHSDDDNAGADKGPPRDLEFEVGMIRGREDSPKLKLPEAKDTLFVTKPIGDYEPIKSSATGKTDAGMNSSQGVGLAKFDPNPDQVWKKKKFNSEPKNHAEIRDISKPLTGEELQRVMAGPTFIDFGQVHVKSQKTKTFFIRNDLRTSISVQLFADNDELKYSYLKPQIIPSSQTAAFEVTVCSSQLHTLK